MPGPQASPPQIFDRALVARRLAAARRTQPDFISQLVIDDLPDRLGPVTRAFEKALIMGPDARLLPAAGHAGEGPVTFERVSTLVPSGLPLVDPENLRLPGREYELIVSLLDLQLVNDVPGFLARVRAHLAPDGLMLLAAIGGNTLTELRSAWLNADAELTGGAAPRIAPFMDIRDGGALLQRTGFALPVTDVDQHVVRYSSPLALMQDLHALGATNPLVDRPRRMTTRSHLAAASAAYEAAAADADGRVRATLEIVWMSGWAPHESQQQPLAPGSAEVSLKDVLGDRSGGSKN